MIMIQSYPQLSMHYLNLLKNLKRTLVLNYMVSNPVDKMDKTVFQAILPIVNGNTR